MTINGMSSLAHKNKKVLFSPPVIFWKRRLPALLQIIHSLMSTFTELEGLKWKPRFKQTHVTHVDVLILSLARNGKQRKGRRTESRKASLCCAAQLGGEAHS